MNDDGLVLRTLTVQFAVERRIFHIGEVELPRPITITQLIAFVGALIAVVMVTHVMGPAPVTWIPLVYGGVPIATAWGIERHFAVLEERRPIPWLVTQLRHRLVEPRLLERLQRSAHQVQTLTLKLPCTAQVRRSRARVSTSSRRLLRRGVDSTPVRTRAGIAPERLRLIAQLLVW